MSEQTAEALARVLDRAEAVDESEAEAVISLRKSLRLGYIAAGRYFFVLAGCAAGCAACSRAAASFFQRIWKSTTHWSMPASMVLAH